MANAQCLRPRAVLVAIAALLSQAPAALGWIPRLLASRGVTCVCVGRGRQPTPLSARGSDDDDERTDDEPRRRRRPRDLGEGQEPLYAEGNEIHKYMISRLEAIYEMDSDLGAAAVEGEASSSTRRLLDDGGERVVLGDWMEWEDGACFGDSCGDDLDQCDIPEEYKVASPKVDVMSFLGIRRAEPLKVMRDWD